jgi:predicted phosphodiesterase
MHKSKNQLKEIIFDIKNIAKKVGVDPADLSKAAYFSNGGKFLEWDFRKMGGYSSIVKSHFEKINDKNFGLITDIKEIRRQHLKLEKQIGDQDLFLDRIKEAVSDIPKVSLTPFKPKKNKNLEERTLHINLSDLHFGSDLSGKENMHNWGSIEESRAIAQVTKNVIEYKTQYRDNTALVVNILGDVIQNELHGRTSAELLHIQTCRAIWLLKQVIARFAENFKLVKVNFASGNHGRDTAIHKQRAVHMKFNSIETTIYFAVRTALEHVPNVSFNHPMTPWVSYEANGHKIYATHGDTHLNPGNPGKNVNIGSLENQMNRINASLKDTEEYKVFIVGHVHLPLVTELPNGSYLVVNGALTPPDSFAQSLNIMESQPAQVLFESTEKHPVGDFRFINVGDSANNSELDKLIKPFKGL